MLAKITWRCAAVLVLVTPLLTIARADTQTLPRATPQPGPTYTPGTIPQPRSTTQATTKVTPRLDPVAETKLLMEGLANPNFHSIDRFLKQKPDNVETWKFMRGQALLIAETANLLMLRPPHNQGQAVWFERTMQMREAAKQLARAAGIRDYERSRSLFVNLANTCNRCHQSFRVSVEIVPFQEPAADKAPSSP